MGALNRLRFAALAGGVIFAVWGLVESAVHLRPVPWWPAVTMRAAQAMGLYALVGALLVGAWGTTALRLDPRTYRLRALAAGVLAVAYVLFGFHINRAFFGSYASPPSLLFTAAWTGLFLWLLLRLRRAEGGAAPLASRGPRLDRMLHVAAAGVLLVVLAALALPTLWTQPAGAGAAQPAAGAARPNVLLVVMDTVRADHVSAYGYPRPTTPNLDRLAREGAVFERASTAMPWAPAHISLLTGLYMSQHGTNAEQRVLDPRAVPLAEMLQAEGYETLAVSNNGWFGRWANLQRGFDRFIEIWRGDRLFFHLTLGQIARGLAGPTLTDENDANGPLTNRLIRRWLDHEYDPARPFFIFINYFEPQFFYEPSEPYRSRFLDPARRELARGHGLRTLNRNPPPVRLDAPTRAVLSDLYDGEVAYLDAIIGELIADLRERGVLDRTLVVVTSDHGENLGDHELLEHRTNLYETVLHVPLLVRYPATFAAGTRVSAPVSLVDVVPTVLALTRTPVAPGLEAMLPGRALTGPAGAEDRPIVAEDSASRELMQRYAKPFDERYFTRSLKSLRQGTWKFIWSSDGRHELFDLADDPGETTNLMEREPERGQAMEAQLHAFLGALRPLPPSGAQRGGDA
jgi:arylsulfatase A-like enzyme